MDERKTKVQSSIQSHDVQIWGKCSKRWSYSNICMPHLRIAFVKFLKQHNFSLHNFAFFVLVFVLGFPMKCNKFCSNIKDKKIIKRFFEELITSSVSIIRISVKSWLHVNTVLMTVLISFCVDKLINVLSFHLTTGNLTCLLTVSSLQ